MQATASVSCGLRLTERLALGLDPRRTLLYDRCRHSARDHDWICVFWPMLVVSAAAYTGHVLLGSNFAWLGTAPALTMLSVAAVVEILAYYVAVLDNPLDALATPAAFVAGTIVSAAVMVDVPPMLKCTAEVVAGGGTAGLTEAAIEALRVQSTVLTRGLGNWIIATAELGGALPTSFLALASADRRNRVGNPLSVVDYASAPPVASLEPSASRPPQGLRRQRDPKNRLLAEALEGSSRN
jgi:hypothetical protein